MRCRWSLQDPPDSAKQALATLDSALKTESTQVVRQQILNLRKDEQLSSIPWLNKKLLSVELAPYLRKMLSQANWIGARAVC